jgi:hypothetical protein
MPTRTENLSSDLAIAYSDGSWTHDLRGGDFAVEMAGPVLTLKMSLSRKLQKRRRSGVKAKLRELLAKREALESIQISDPDTGKWLKRIVREQERFQACVKLLVEEHETVYPATFRFGPDAVTLNLG